MKIKMIIFDLDGTLLNSEKKITDVTQDSIQKWREKFSNENYYRIAHKNATKLKVIQAVSENLSI